MGHAADFQTFAARKTREASSAVIERLSTVFERPDHMPTQQIGNSWSRRHYGGDFGLTVPTHDVTAVSLVFIQTTEGNTGGADPGAFGGGATDTHLIYEGLSRVAADAVLAGSGSLHVNSFFSVWHPELVALRASLGLTRHPLQIVVSKRGHFDLGMLLFNIPEVAVWLLAGDECIARHESAVAARPWIRLVHVHGDDLRPPIDQLRRQNGIRRISVIGGRRTASQLVDRGLAQDIFLTTT
jgi:hypothetical protein